MEKKLFLVFVFIFCVSLKAQVGINTTTPGSTLDVQGSQTVKYNFITTNTVLNSTHHAVLIANGITATLPAPAANLIGRVYKIQGPYSGLNGTLSCVTPNTIVASNSSLLTNFPVWAMQTLSVYCDGTYWWVRDLTTNGVITGVNVLSSIDYTEPAVGNDGQVHTNGIAVTNFNLGFLANGSASTTTDIGRHFGVFEISIFFNDSSFRLGRVNLLYSGHNNTGTNSPGQLTFVSATNSFTDNSGNFTPIFSNPPIAGLFDGTFARDQVSIAGLTIDVGICAGCGGRMVARVTNNLGAPAFFGIIVRKLAG